MSLLDLMLIVTGSISALAIISAVLWLLVTLIQETASEPSITNIVALLIFICIVIFSILFPYSKIKDKDTIEYQQYLELKAKYEKE